MRDERFTALADEAALRLQAASAAVASQPAAARPRRFS